MAMSFSNVLRGRLAERILVTLLERGGYRVTRLGIEELFDEVKYLPLKQYLDLGLPPALRTLPDLLVSNPDVSWARLIEVKFRQRFDSDVAQELHATLTEQRKYWPESWAIIMIGEPFAQDGRFHQDYVRVVGPTETDRLIEVPSWLDEADDKKRVELRWNRLSMLYSVLDSVQRDTLPAEKERLKELWSAADHITRAIRELGKV